MNPHYNNLIPQCKVSTLIPFPYPHLTKKPTLAEVSIPWKKTQDLKDFQNLALVLLQSLTYAAITINNSLIHINVLFSII